MNPVNAMSLATSAAVKSAQQAGQKTQVARKEAALSPVKVVETNSGKVETFNVEVTAVDPNSMLKGKSSEKIIKMPNHQKIAQQAVEAISIGQVTPQDLMEKLNKIQQKKPELANQLMISIQFSLNEAVGQKSDPAVKKTLARAAEVLFDFNVFDSLDLERDFGGQIEEDVPVFS